MDVTTTTDVDVAADAALVYLEVTAIAGFGLSFSSHAAVDVVMDSLVETITVDADAFPIPPQTSVAIAVSGLLFFFSSVAAATTTVAANS